MQRLLPRPWSGTARPMKGMYSSLEVVINLSLVAKMEKKGLLPFRDRMLSSL